MVRRHSRERGCIGYWFWFQLLFWCEGWLGAGEIHGAVSKPYLRNLLDQTVYSSFFQILNTTLQGVQQELHAIPEVMYESLLYADEYSTMQSLVRYTSLDTICPDEKEVVARRLANVSRQLISCLPPTAELTYVPRIAVCCSGGGFRAMLATSGLLAGLHDIGVLDCITYISSLSGSSWCIAPWISSGMSAYEYRVAIAAKISEAFEPLQAYPDLAMVINTIIQRLVYGQKISAIDI